jgi:tripartite-type tricarboxylate transporter receptor subunit TctC
MHHLEKYHQEEKGMKKKDFIAMVGFWAVLMVLAVVTFLPQPVQSEEFPGRAITIVVPFTPGGRTDLTSRIFAQFMKKYTNGQPVVILNKPGSGSVIGMTYVATSKPDGYTLLAEGTAVLTVPYILSSPLSFKDYAGLGRMSNDPDVLVVNTSALPVQNVKEFIAYGKQNPRKLIAAITPGGANDLHARAFAKLAGIEMRYLPFAGGGERITAVIGGHANCMFDVPTGVTPAVKSGKAKIIGIAEEKRHPDFPGIRTWKEDGIDLVLGGWQALFAPKNTPPDILAKLEAIVAKAGNDPECIKALTDAEIYPGYLSPKDFYKAMVEEDKFTKEIVETAGIKAQ